MAELREQTGEVIAIRGGSGKLPIHIEAIENAWRNQARCKIAANIHVHAAFYESRAICGECRRAECVRVRASAPDGHDDLEMRIQLLELLELMKVACEGSLAICLTVDRVPGRDGSLVVCPRVKADASIVDDVGEGVVEMGQKRSGTAGDDVLDKIVRVDPPPRKVPDNFHRGSAVRGAHLSEEF